MSANRKPRKAHKPSAPRIPMTIRFNSDDERKLQLVPHQELAKMIAGDGDATSWHTITARLNVGLVLAINHFTGASQMVMAGALNAICAVKERFERVGKYGVSGDESSLIGAGLGLTDDLQISTTRRQMRDAIERVYREGAV